MNVPGPPVTHTIEKINGEWFLWAGDPKILRPAEALAGPFAKRYQVFAEAQRLAVEALHAR